jgi:pimeloyl-ACP methyl ester carboxylesterase
VGVTWVERLAKHEGEDDDEDALSRKLTRRPPMPSLATPRWTPAWTGFTTGRGRPCTAAATLRDRGSTASASTPTIIPSRPPAPRTPTSCQTLPGRTSPPSVIKGRCDYLSWSSAQEYLEALPHARLLYMQEAGHNAYQDEPERYMAGVRAFLLDQPLPERPYEGNHLPEDYEGPP